MQRKCLVCSTKFSLLSGPKERLYCSAECSQKANCAKGSFSDEDLVSMCSAIANKGAA